MLWLNFGPGQFSSSVMKLDFISQPSSKSTLPIVGLHRIKKCQVSWNMPLSLVALHFDPNEWCGKNCLLSEGLNPKIS